MSKKDVMIIKLALVFKSLVLDIMNQIVINAAMRLNNSLKNLNREFIV